MNAEDERRWKIVSSRSQVLTEKISPLGLGRVVNGELVDRCKSDFTTKDSIRRNVQENDALDSSYLKNILRENAGKDALFHQERSTVESLIAKHEQAIGIKSDIGSIFYYEDDDDGSSVAFYDCNEEEEEEVEAEKESSNVTPSNQLLSMDFECSGNYKFGLPLYDSEEEELEFEEEQFDSNITAVSEVLSAVTTVDRYTPSFLTNNCLPQVRAKIERHPRNFTEQVGAECLETSESSIESTQARSKQDPPNNPSLEFLEKLDLVRVN